MNALSVTIGGGRSYALNLLRELDRIDRGLDVTFVVPEGDLSSVAPKNIRVKVLPMPSRVGPLRVATRLLFEYIWLPVASARYDVLFSVADLSPPFALAPRVVALANLNIYDRRFYDNWRTRSLFRLAKLGVGRARKVVVATRGAADRIREYLPFPETKLEVVPHGISPERFDQKPVDGRSRPYLFVPAALERHKGFATLIDAVSLFGDSAVEVQVVGPLDTDPVHAERMRARIRDRGVEGRLKLLGPVPYDRVASLYAGAKALVFPSELETFGHPVLEAMAFGTPLVLSDIPPSRELAGDCARYFKVGDAGELAAAVDALDSDPAGTQARVEAARSRAGEFTWERSVDRLAEVLKDAARE